MSLQTQLTAVVQQIARDVKTLLAQDGNLNALSTIEKASLVAAINEVNEHLNNLIDDAALAGNTTHTYSADKILTLFNTFKSDILGEGVSAAYDQLVEIQNFLQGNDTAIGNLLTAVSNRVRFDDAQSLTNEQQAQARANIGAASAAAVGDTNRNFVADYTAARDAA